MSVNRAGGSSGHQIPPAAEPHFGTPRALQMPALGRLLPAAGTVMPSGNL